MFVIWPAKLHVRLIHFTHVRFGLRLCVALDALIRQLALWGAPVGRLAGFSVRCYSVYLSDLPCWLANSQRWLRQFKVLARQSKVLAHKCRTFAALLY